MYQDELKWEPPQGLAFLQQVLKNPGDMTKLALSEQEPKNLLFIARANLGSKPGRSGRPTKESEHIYAAISKLIISSGKSRFRHSAINHTARRIFLLRERGMSYREILLEMNPDKQQTIRDMEHAKRVRFEVQKQIKKLTAKKVRK
jgi:hypothetical protein